jgi:septal ring factor EnvC (AmiA/AmiB activator)
MRHQIRNVLACISALLVVSVLSVTAQDLTKQKNKKRQLEKDIELLDKQIAGIKQQSASATSRLEMLRQNISARKELVAESDRLIKSYNDSIKVKDSEINILQNEVDTLVHYYGKMVRNAYKYRDPRVWYLYVFASDNLGQAFRRAGYFRNISAQIRSEADVIRSKQAELETQKGLLDVLKQDALAEKDSRVKELNNLRKDEKEADQLVQQLKNDKKKIESQIAQKRKEVDKLNKEIQKKIAEAQKSKSTPSGAKRDDSQDIKLSGEFANNKGKLPWPASGVVVGKFGKRYHPVFKNLELPSNEGIDIAAEKGAEVKCVFDGQVLDVFVMPTYGQCVLVQHGKTYFTFYCKLCNVAVSKGDSVKTGQTIGVVDQINGSSQMHFEVWKDKVPQNPSNWLR